MVLDALDVEAHRHDAVGELAEDLGAAVRGDRHVAPRQDDERGARVGAQPRQRLAPASQAEQRDGRRGADRRGDGDRVRRAAGRGEDRHGPRRPLGQHRGAR